MSEPVIIKDVGCIIEAIKLKENNGGKGSVFYVPEINGKPVGQSFFIPDETVLDKLALNQSDNGYFLRRELTVREVLEHGTRYQ